MKSGILDISTRKVLKLLVMAMSGAMFLNPGVTLEIMMLR